MSIQPNDIDHIEIFPPIAVARLGNADPTTYYLGPEVPDVEPIPPLTESTKFKIRDEQGRIRRQAARFHAYAFDRCGKVLGELTKADKYILEWTVSVANKKAAWVKFRGKVYEETYKLRNQAVLLKEGDEMDADEYDARVDPSLVYDYTNKRNRLIIRACAKVITSDDTSQKYKPLSGIFDGGVGSTKSVTLGHLTVDEKGSLIFVAGDGDSQCVAGGNKPPYPDLTEKFDSEYWYDSTCDGDVTLVVHHPLIDGCKKSTTHKATIITAPPKFTPGLSCVASLYDVMEDVYERPKRAVLGSTYDCGTVDYYRHIKPLFHGVSLLSWTSQKAYQGHGPHKLPHFKDELLDNPEENQSLRQAIFDRVRAPVNPDNPQDPYIRNAQAYEYYMPRISGDAGDNPGPPPTPINNRGRWGSLTELQHDRLSKWAEGNFDTGSKPEVDRLKKTYTDYPVGEQPTILSRAALQWTTGLPLYPGIEAYWIVELSEIYERRGCQDPEGIFRLKKSKDGGCKDGGCKDGDSKDGGKTDTTVKDMEPGDLTKGLSLPWQADFYMCNTHWWPHVRPDDVITEKTFMEIRKELGKDKELPSYLTDRVLWDRDFKKDQDDERVGSTEMVKNWTQLGFISEVQDIKSSMPIYIETERLEIPKPNSVNPTTA